MGESAAVSALRLPVQRQVASFGCSNLMQLQLHVCLSPCVSDFVVLCSGIVH